MDVPSEAGSVQPLEFLNVRFRTQKTDGVSARRGRMALQLQHPGVITMLTIAAQKHGCSISLENILTLLSPEPYGSHDFDANKHYLKEAEERWK
jgi:hypothetical protein